MSVHQGVRGACGGTELLVGEVDRLVKLQMQFVSLRATSASCFWRSLMFAFAMRRSASASVEPAELELAVALRA